MKKYILAWLLSIIWFIGFSNASTYNNETFSCDDNNWYEDEEIWGYYNSVCWPYQAYINSNICDWSLQVVDYDIYNEDEWWAGFYIYDSDQTNSIQAVFYNDWWEVSCDWTFDYDDWYFESYNIKSITFTSDWWFGVIEENSWNTPWDVVWTLLPWWKDALSWAVSWVSSTVNEFIPLVVYIWIWILSAIIWFVAIKWLINRIRSKSLWTFTSNRRK